MATKYIVAANSGVGFITHSDQESLNLSFVGAPANVWTVTGKQADIDSWSFRVSGVVKTKTNAQAIIDSALVGVVDLQNNPVSFVL